MTVEILRLKPPAQGDARSLSQRQTHAGRLLLANMVRRLYGREDAAVTYGPNGKPLLDFCFFSISHSGDLVACAVSERPIGLDIERCNPIKPRKHYPLFSPNECRYINAASNPSLAFYAIWTGKEAYIKALGGRLQDMAAFELTSGNLLSENLGGFSFVRRMENGVFLTVAHQEEASPFLPPIP